MQVFLFPLILEWIEYLLIEENEPLFLELPSHMTSSCFEKRSLSWQLSISRLRLRVV